MKAIECKSSEIIGNIENIISLMREGKRWNGNDDAGACG
jgi:hypothetical protein